MSLQSLHFGSVLQLNGANSFTSYIFLKTQNHLKRININKQKKYRYQNEMF